MMWSALDWSVDGMRWPNRAASRFVSAAGFRWHVQILGGGPTLLLLHGTGASTHSWRDLAPELARDFTVVMPDLPGHGFTEAPRAAVFSLPGMARAVGELLDVLRVQPSTVVGHSAGAAILCRMDVDSILVSKRIMSLNGALLPIPGFAGPVSRSLARALTWNPFVPWLLAWRAGDPHRIRGLLRDMGSKLDDEGVRLYTLLAGNPGHARSALRMMSNWDLVGLEKSLPRIATPTTLITGLRDRFVTPVSAKHVARLMSNCERVVIPDGGHLAHEEQPLRFAELIRERAVA